MNNVEENRSVQDAPTLLVSEKGAGLLNSSANSVLSFPPHKTNSSVYKDEPYDNEWVTRLFTETFTLYSDSYSHVIKYLLKESWACAVPTDLNTGSGSMFSAVAKTDVCVFDHCTGSKNPNQVF